MINRTGQFIVVLIVSLLFAAGTAAGSDKGYEEMEISPGGKLDINCKDGGSVKVTGWDENKAEVRYRDSSGNLKYMDIEIRKTRSGLSITAEINDKSVHTTSLHFDIMLPRQFDIKLKSKGGGLIVTGMEGTFTGKTMGGGLKFRDCQGDVSIKTMGGSIEVVDCKLDGKLHTNGGEVLIEDVTGDLKATSNGGDVRYINVRRHGGVLRAPGKLDEEDITSETVLISSMGGSIDVDDAPEGANVHTAGGRVTVSGAEKFVEARTGGGDMDIIVTNGWIKAWSGAGDIDAEIRLSGGDKAGRSEFFTGKGDVTLELPADISVEFDIDLGYTRNSSRNFKIISDFDMDVEHTNEWDYDHGSPRKHIYGTGKIGGGRHKIKIRNTNGNVRIRKK